MKITGVTIIRNAVKNDYPIVEAINSILPMVDEMIVNIGCGEDDTEGLIRHLQDDKINITLTDWDMNLREGGKVYADETNKAFALVPQDSDWIFYIQADEVIHEKYHAAIIAAAEKYKDDAGVDGLLFAYHHFYATYDYIGDSRKWYTHEIRLIKNNLNITSYRDAQGFRRDGEKLKAALVDATVHHYGWVKSPLQMKAKQKNVYRYYTNNEEVLADFINSAEQFDFNEFDSLKKFTGTHPAVMQKRIAEKNWNVNLDISKKKLTGKKLLLYYFEKLTGLRLFTFKNYRIVR